MSVPRINFDERARLADEPEKRLQRRLRTDRVQRELRTGIKRLLEGKLSWIEAVNHYQGQFALRGNDLELQSFEALGRMIDRGEQKPKVIRPDDFLPLVQAFPDGIARWTEIALQNALDATGLQKASTLDGFHPTVSVNVEPNDLKLSFARTLRNIIHNGQRNGGNPIGIEVVEKGELDTDRMHDALQCLREQGVNTFALDDVGAPNGAFPIEKVPAILADLKVINEVKIDRSLIAEEEHWPRLQETIERFIKDHDQTVIVEGVENTYQLGMLARFQEDSLFMHDGRLLLQGFGLHKPEDYGNAVITLRGEELGRRQKGEYQHA